MIKYTDVRIGNLVYKNGQPAPINAGDFLKVDLGAKELKEIKPIPLTPEWLERCGFSYSAPFYAKRPLMLSKNAIRDGSGNYNGFVLRVKIEDGMQHMVIEHLHQLQNIFHSLTGEELNVKL